MKINKGLRVLLSLTICSFAPFASAQIKDVNFEKLLQVPLQYTIPKTSADIIIDGQDDEEAWSKSPWTEFFTGIESGAESDPSERVQCKMLWDDSCLYVFARLQEKNLWASITQHDASVFQDNAFEIFISPDGNTDNYFEFEINAYATVWDLFMSKPYRNGGQNLSSWDIKGLRKAVQLNGTLNDPSDTDTGWSIELAIPFSSLRLSGDHPLKDGTIWRMNFSRVQWDLDTSNGKYFRKKDANTGKLLPEHYFVWSPQGLVSLHYPERWGYVRFSDQPSSGNFLSSETENLKLILWKYYYLQQEYKKKHGKYANKIKQLNKLYSGPPYFNESNFEIKMYSDGYQFLIRGYSASSQEYYSVDEGGEERMSKMPR